VYKSKVFLVGENRDNLIALEETGYVNEKALQDFLVTYPDLLPGDQINPENPRRWLLVAREMGVPGDTDETGRWSLDHLFLDQDGIPTFVECKRATDTRGRREVVAQMLDYAANGTMYWSIDKLRQAATETAAKQGKSLDDLITNLLGQEESAEEESKLAIEKFWVLVEHNLREPRIRLIFVADSTPKELRRLVEFLNEEMTNIEVLAVEIKQYQGVSSTQQRALVPRVVGLTESGRKLPPTASQRRTTRPEFLEKCAPDARPFFERVIDDALARGHTVYWGEVGFSVRARSARNGRLATYVYGYPEATFQCYLDPNWQLTEEESATLRSRLLSFGVLKETGRHTLTALVTAANLTRLNEVYDFMLAWTEPEAPSSG
jgi:hypothetical protein